MGPTFLTSVSTNIPSVPLSLSPFFFFFWPCPWHVEVPRARDQTRATAVTQATAVTVHFFKFFFLATPMTCGSFQARDQTHATASTRATVVGFLTPYTTGGSPKWKI